MNATRALAIAGITALSVACVETPTSPAISMQQPRMAVTFDPATGSGFVGKGDVQYTFDWNNKALQDNAALVAFRVSSTIVTEVSWTCTNSNNQNEQIRARTTTTSLQGIVESVARERNQITGFNLVGYDGAPTNSSTTEGPAVNSCPSGPWSLTTPAGDPVEVSNEGGGMEVSKDGGSNFTPLLIKPI